MREPSVRLSLHPGPVAARPDPTEKGPHFLFCGENLTPDSGLTPPIAVDHQPKQTEHDQMETVRFRDR